jgi:hypothetical protein
MSSQLEGRCEALGAYLSEREPDLMPGRTGVWINSGDQAITVAVPVRLLEEDRN